ncbi:MAG: hypothetical protein AB7N76_32210 [Planctomycetota bacterium]
MSDEDLRALERAARLGDASAAAALARARSRRGGASAIELAHARLSGGDAEGALAALLARWAEVPSADLAAAIEGLSEHVAGDRGVVRGRTSGAILLESQRLLREGDAFDRPRAIRAWESLRCGDAGELLPLVQAGPRDPRTSAALLALCERTPIGWEGKKHVPFWRQVLAELERHGDPRARARLEQGLDAFFYLRGEEVQGACERLPSPAELLPDEAAALAGLLTSLEPQADPDLGARWDAVYAEPSADAPREALAEALAAAGDPRGEFLRLQLARARQGKSGLSQREQQLLRTYGREWAGSLGQLLGSALWRRGLPVRVHARRAPSEPLIAREVAQLEELVLGPGLAGQALLAALPCCPPRLGGVTLDQLEAGLACRVVDLGELLQESTLERLCRCGPSEALRALSAAVGQTVSGLRALWGSPLGRGLEHLWLRHATSTLAAWGLELPSPGQGRLQTLRVTGEALESGAFRQELIYHRASSESPWHLLWRRPQPRALTLTPAQLAGPVETITVEEAAWPGQEAIEAYFADGEVPARSYG